MATMKSLVPRSDPNRLSWTLFNFKNKMPTIDNNSDKLQNSTARMQTLNSSPRIKPLKGAISCRRKGVSIEKIPAQNTNFQAKQSAPVKPVYPIKLPLHTDVLETNPDVYRLDLGNEEPATARTLSNMKVVLLNNHMSIRKKSDPILKESNPDFQQRFEKQYKHFRRTQHTNMMHYLGKFKSLAEINNRANSLYFRIDESQGRIRGHSTAREFASQERKESNPPPFVRNQSPEIAIGRKGQSDANADYFSHQQQKSASVTRLNVKTETQVSISPIKRITTEEPQRRQTFSSPTNFWTPIQETPSLSSEFDIYKQKDFNLDSEGIRSPLPKNETGQLLKFVINEESPHRITRMSPQLKKVSLRKDSSPQSKSPQGRENSNSPRLQFPPPILNIEFRNDQFEDPKTRKNSRQPSEVRGYPPESTEPRTPEINHKAIIVRKKPVRIKTQAPRAFVQRSVNRSKSLGGIMPKRQIGLNANGEQNGDKSGTSRKGNFRLVKGKRVEEISELEVEGWEHSKNTHNTHNNTVEKKSINMGSQLVA